MENSAQETDAERRQTQQRKKKKNEPQRSHQMILDFFIHDALVM